MLDLPLGNGGIELELWDMELRVVYESMGEGASLQIWHRPPSTRPVEPERFATVQQDGWTRVERQDAEEAQAPRLQGELRVVRGQTLRLVGHALDLQVHTSESNEVDLDGEKDSEPPPFGRPIGGELDEKGRGESDEEAVFGLELALEGSQVELARTESASIWIRNTRLDLRGGQGQLVLSAEGSRARLQGFHGKLVFEGQGSDLEAEDLQGASEIRLQGGSVVLRRGQGRIEAQGDGSYLSVEEWSGPVTLGGIASNVEVRDLQTGKSPLTLRGRDLDCNLLRIRGSLAGRLQAGSLRGEQIDGKIDLAATERSDLTLEDLKGQVNLDLADASRARIRSANFVKIEARGAELEIDGARSLDLTLSEYSSVVLLGESPVAVVKLTDSEMRSQGGELSGRPSLVLDGASSAQVELRAPCLVNVSQQGALYGSQATVSGCELATPGNRAQRRQRRYTTPATQLRVTLGDEARLEVDGS